MGVVAGWMDQAVTAGAAAVVALVLVQRISLLGRVPRPAVIGICQMVVGLVVVAASAVGVLVEAR